MKKNLSKRWDLKVVIHPRCNPVDLSHANWRNKPRRCRTESTVIFQHRRPTLGDKDRGPKARETQESHLKLAEDAGQPDLERVQVIPAIPGLPKAKLPLLVH